MAKLTEVQIYEIILKNITKETIELQEKIKKFVGPAREEIAQHETLVINIQDCKYLISLLKVEKIKLTDSDNNEIRRIKSIFQTERHIMVPWETPERSPDEQIDEHDPNPYRSGKYRNS
jgi:hypothetical protein